MDTLYNIFVSKPSKCRFKSTPYYPRLGWGCSSGDTVIPEINACLKKCELDKNDDIF